MTYSEKIELIKKLETIVVFQEGCLNDGNWDDYDKIESEIEKLEEKIVNAGNN